MGRLSDKVAVITGGASGIGAATVRLFAAEGARVLVTDVQTALGEALAEETGVTFIEQDVSDPAGWRRVEERVESEFGRLDVMFNNAGTMCGKNVEDIDLETWNRVFATNVTGVMLGSQMAISLMKKNPGGSSGSIINTASTVSFMGIPQDVAYTASKGAVRAMTKSIAVYAAREFNIRCNALVPGATRTGMLQPHLDSDPAAEEHTMNMSPFGRIADPADLAAMVLFLASDESRFCTGAEFIVDGGMLCSHPGM